MARYRQKDDNDLAWNAIRTRITREFDTELKLARERSLNTLLSKAWEDYTAAIGEGRVPEIENKYTHLVTSIVQDVLPQQIVEASGAEVD